MVRGAELAAFEQRWAEWNGLPSVGLSSWAGGALAALEFAGVRGETVLCPSNTFMATPLAAIGAGAEVEFVDCNREDLCMSFEDFEAKAERPQAAGGDPRPHRRPHRLRRRADRRLLPRRNGIFLLEDCAHAHGADWNGAQPGGFGDAGVYSLLRDQDRLDRRGRRARLRQRRTCSSSPRKFRNYGKFEHEVDGLNFRMSEFTAALGLVQAERMEEIVALEERVRPRASRPRAPGAARAARGDDLGPLQVHRLRADREVAPGRVYEQPCHRIMGRADELPNTDWVAENHWCVPLYYRPESRARRRSARRDA